MTSSYCSTCLSHYSISNFRFFLCGHGFCVSCTERFFEKRRKYECPCCRTPIVLADAHQIYLEVLQENASVSQVSVAIDNLAQIDCSSSLSAVAQTEISMKKAAESLQLNTDMANKLFSAVNNFREKITPIFAVLETQSAQLRQLQTDLEAAQRAEERWKFKAEQLNSLQERCQKLKNDSEQLRKERDKALTLAEQAAAKTIDLQAKQDETVVSIEELTTQNKQYQDQLYRHRKAARGQRDKIRCLKSKITELTIQLDNRAEGIVSETEAMILNDCPPIDSVLALPSSSIEPEEFDADSDAFGALPPPKFVSDWKLHGKKRKSNDAGIGEERFPIKLDNKGHALKTVKLGPRTRLRGN